jgi:hypothetical protein
MTDGLTSSFVHAHNRVPHSKGMDEDKPKDILPGAIKLSARMLAVALKARPDLRDVLLRGCPDVTSEDLDWFLSIARGEVPDDKILDRGLALMQRMQPIKLN